MITALPDHRALVDLPSDLDALRWVVQACYCIVDWAPAYGVAGEAILANPSCGSGSRAQILVDLTEAQR
jgi:hypothetical protein